MRKLLTLLCMLAWLLPAQAQTVTRSWDFDDPVVNRVADGWNISLYGNPNVDNGILKLTAVNQGGYCNINFNAPAGQSIVDPSVSKRFIIRIKNGTKDRIGSFLWKVDNEENFRRMEILMTTEDTQFKEYVLDLTHDLRWTGNITNILMQLPIPINAHSNNLPVEIDYIRFTESVTTAQLPVMVAKTPAPFGVNLSGGEFSFNAPPSNWRYPRTHELDYLASKGFRLIRLPFLWERVQPTLNGPLDIESLSHLKNLVWAARARGIWVLLDLHNYNRRRFVNSTTNKVTQVVIGAPEVPISTIQDFWKKMAHEFKDFDNIYAYGIMNEPYGIPKETPWVNTAQEIIDAIRTEDTHNTIMVGGDSYSSASNWPSVSDNLRKLKDPSNNLMFEAHTYFDKSAGGTYLGSYVTEEATPQVGVNRLTPFINWLKTHNLRGFVGEYGVPNNPNADADKADAADNSQWNTVLNNALQYMKTNGVSGTYWSYGTSWGTYKLNVLPNSDGSERPQMQVLSQHLFADAPSALPGITSPFVVNYNIANTVSYQLTATNNPTGFTVTGLPTGLTYNSATHEISGTILAGEHIITVNATNTQGTGEVREVILRGVESKIPGIIEAENYDTGGQNVSYYDRTIGNSGGFRYRDEDVDLKRTGTSGNYTYAVTHAFGGEWLKYTAEVEQQGNYGVKLRYTTTTAGGVIRIKLDDVVVQDNIPLPVTPDLSTWNEAYFELLNVSEGQHTVLIEVVSGDSDFDRMNFDLILPAEVPANLSATAFGSKRVDLSWNAAANATSYKIERSETAGGPYTVIAQNVNTTTFSDENVVGTTTYYYVVRGVNVLGESAASAMASVTTETLTLPQKVSGFVAFAGGGRVELQWTEVPDVTKYNIKRSTVQGGPYTLLASPTTAEYVDTDVINNTSYYYVVAAENEDGEGENSDEVIAKPILGNYAHYTFDLTNSATATTPVIDSWGGRHASFDPNVLIGTNQSTSHITFLDGANAKLNGAMRFRARVGSYVRLPSGFMSDVDDFTISFWFRQVANQNGSRLFEFGVGDNYTSATPESERKYMYLSARSGTGNVLTYGAQNGAIQKTLSTSVSIANTTTFRHYVVTQSGNTVTIYLDGQQVGQSTDFTIKPSDFGITTDNYIGRSRTTVAKVDGVFDEFKVFNRALTSTEITMLYNNNTLPVSFLDFTAKKQNSGDVLLNWSTASERNNSHFEILRSSDGNRFDNIASISGSNNSDVNKSYSYVDYSPLSGKNYYQLKQVDYDGKSSVHPELVVIDGNLDKEDLKMFVAQNQLNLVANVGKANSFKVYLSEISGRKVAEFSGNVSPGTNSFKYPLNQLSSGVYVATYVSVDDKVSVKLLVR